jgi:hypothetical protein
MNLNAISSAAKEYDANWLGSGKSIYRQGGKFASKTGGSSPESTDLNAQVSKYKIQYWNEKL